jgi:citrate lyase gamma subunit
MLVPEASVNKYHLLARRENKVRFARKVHPVKTEPITISVEEFTQKQFGRSIL